MPKIRKPAHTTNQSQVKLDAQSEAIQAQLASVIELVPLEQVKPSPKNPRTHSKKQLNQLVQSMREFGYTAPALIDEHNQILAGHGRLEAAKVLGLKVIPCVRLTHMSEAQKRAYIIADNQLALKAGWDEDLLAEELEALMGLDPGYDLTLTGFSIPEIDTVIANHKPEKPGNPDDDLLPDPAQVRRRCKPGDIFQLGPHRLICGDARDHNAIAALMDGNLARMAFVDPPYNVPIEGNVGGLGRIKHGEFAMGSGEMTRSEFTAFLKASFVNLVAFSHDGSIHFICMDWRHVAEIKDAADGIFSEMKNLIIWKKHNAGMGSFYRSQHELIFVFKNGTAAHINNFELGQHGRYRTNVWEYAGASSFKANRLEELALHPTVKPVQMLADAMKDVSARGDIVLDLFGGSGSTLIAAHKTGRRAYLCEYDPLYCDKIIARFEAFAHEDAEFLKNIGPACNDEGASHERK
jgi:DNA modification methylase